jgi:hypothetical protein
LTKFAFVAIKDIVRVAHGGFLRSLPIGGDIADFDWSAADKRISVRSRIDR